MYRFTGLVKNEYKKMFSKASTWVLIGILVVMSAFLTFIAFFSMNGIQAISKLGPEFDNTYQMAVNQQTKDINNTILIAQFDLLKNAGLTNLNNINTDFRYDAAHQWASVKVNLDAQNIPKTEVLKYQDFESKVKTAILNNDFSAYVNAKVDMFNSNLSTNNLIVDSGMGLEGWQYVKSSNISFSNWKFQIVQQLQIEKADYNLNLTKPIAEKNQIALNQYRLDNNVQYVDNGDGISSFAGMSSDTAINQGSDNIIVSATHTANTSFKFGFWESLANSAGQAGTVSILIIIIAGGLISSEFSSGTIKSLLVKPIKRWKVITAKYFSLLTITFIMVLLYFIVSFLISALLGGLTEFSSQHLTVTNGIVTAHSSLSDSIVRYLSTCIKIVVMATLAFSLSSLFRNTALAVAIGISGFFAGTIITMFLVNYHQDWGRYLVFANVDIYNISNNTTQFVGQSVLFAVINISIYMIVFLLTAWDAFVRRDIK